MSSRTPRTLRRVLLVAFAVTIALFAFGPAIRAPFAFDDEVSILANQSIRSIWPPSIPLSPPRDGTPVSGRPAVNATFALNYALNRALGIDDRSAMDDPAEPIGFHLANILLHVGTALLLFGIVARTLRGPGIPGDWSERSEPLAGVIALLWLVHPIQTEAVDYLSQRTELLVSACFAAVIYASIRAWGDADRGRATPGASDTSATSRRNWSVVAIVASLIGMASKEVMLTAPIMVVLYDRAFRVESWRDLLGAKQFTARRRMYAGLFATLLVGLAFVAIGSRGETVSFHGTVRWYQYALSQAWAVAHYLRLVLWPSGFSYDYGLAAIGGARVVPGMVVLALLGAATIVAWMRPSTRWLGFAGAWFFLLLAPSSSVVPIQTEIAAERRVYLALAGVLAALVIGADAGRRRLAARVPWLASRGAVVGSVIALATALVVVSAKRSAMYRSPEALWADATHVMPTDARAFDNLAASELLEHPPRVAAAESLLRHAIAIDSTYVRAITRLGTIAISEGKLDTAQYWLERSLRLAPRDSIAMTQMGRVLLANGEPDSALPYLRRVTDRAPTASSLVDLGNAYLSAGQLGPAAATLRRALALDTSRVDAMSSLGGALVEQDSGAAAAAVLEDAVARERDASFDLALLGVAYAENGRVRESVAAESLATSAQSADVAVFVLAGRALFDDGNASGAKRLLEHAVMLSPSDPQAETRLAIADAALGDQSEADSLLRAVLSAHPDYDLARRGVQGLPAPP